MLLILSKGNKCAKESWTIAGKLSNRLRERNVEFIWSSFDKVEFYIEKNKIEAYIDGKNISSFSKIFIKGSKGSKSAVFVLAKIAESRGIPFIDEQHALAYYFGKFQQMFLLASEKISIPKTYYSISYNERQIENAINYLGLPIVVKNSQGRRGKNILLAETKDELIEKIQNMKVREIILQEFIPNKFDYRVLVLGDKVAVVERRTRIVDDNEFRNNVSLGAKEEFLEIENVDKNIKEMAEKAAHILRLQVAGADIIISPEGDEFVIEVNRSPAFTRDENISNEIRLLSEYLSK